MEWLRYKTRVSKNIFCKDFYLGTYTAQHKGAPKVAERLVSLYKELKLQPQHAPALTHPAPGSCPEGTANKRVRHGGGFHHLRLRNCTASWEEVPSLGKLQHLASYKLVQCLPLQRFGRLNCPGGGLRTDAEMQSMWGYWLVILAVLSILI